MRRKRTETDELRDFADEKQSTDFLRAQVARLTAQLFRAQAAQAENRLLRAQLASKDREMEATLGLKHSIDTFTIKPSASKRTNEATLWMVASDWHIEEHVSPDMVNDLNSYDLNESKRRATLFFQRGLRLMRMFAQDIAIPQVVMPLIGDMISGSIHEDLAESNLLPPTDAAMRWVEYVASGLEFLLAETKQAGTTFYLPCHTGNHGRMTKEQRIQTEAGNSLERIMYAQLAAHFRHESRVTFNIASSYHSFVKCYDMNVRVHHGHAIKYHGGVGGPTIAINKAINEWNTARRADLDVFGHLHWYNDADNFVSNGSLIGHAPYTVRIKGKYQKPKQALFLIDKKRGKSISAPIMFD